MTGAGSATSLYGRTKELDEIRQRLDDVDSGTRRTVLIEGEPGIGKTRLVQRTIGEAGARGFSVVAASADQIDRNRPFGPLADALECSIGTADPQRQEIARMLFGQEDAGSLDAFGRAGVQFRVLEAIVALVESMALRHPVALAFEDLQWADSSSLMALTALNRRLASLPLLLIGTFRPYPPVPDLERLVDEASVHLLLGALDDDAVNEIVAERVGAVPGPNLRRALRGAGGNPLFATELVAGMGQEGRIRFAAGLAEIDKGVLPRTLRLTILKRITYASDESLDLLSVASVLGSSFTVIDLSIVVGRSTVALLEPLRQCIGAGILVERGKRLAFCHDLIREALYEDLPEPIRAGLHREAARALAAVGVPAERLAEHLVRGACPGDTIALQMLSEAARAVAPRSPTVAAQLLDRAIEIGDPSDPGRDDLIVRRSIALLWAGRVRESEEAAHELLARNHTACVDGRARITLVHALLAEGRIEDALTQAEEALESSSLSAIERARIGAWGSHARMLAGDLPGAEDLARAATGWAKTAGDAFATCVAMACRSMVSELRADFSGAFARIDQAVRLADASPGREGHRFQLHVMRGLFLIDMDRFEKAQQSLIVGQRISREIDSPWSLPLFHLAASVGKFLHGQWDDAMAEIEAGLELSRDVGMSHGAVCTSSIRSMVALHRDDLENAEKACQSAERESADTGPQYRADWAMWARALLLEAEGRPADALACLVSAWNLCTRMGFAVEFPILGPDLVRLAMLLGDRHQAELAAQQIQAVSKKNPGVESAAAAASLCLGLIETNIGMLEESAARYRSAGRKRESAVAGEAAAVTRAGAGQLAEAAALFGDALHTYDHLGARRDVARISARMREFNIRRGRRGARRRPSTGWGALTASEREIARLAVEGLSNPKIAERLFISPRTVQTHMAHLFRKLGIASRVELARQVAIPPP